VLQYFVVVPARHPRAGDGLPLAAKADFLALTAFEISMLIGFITTFPGQLWAHPARHRRHHVSPSRYLPPPHSGR